MFGEPAMTVTREDHARMSWHQRQTLNAHLLAETERLATKLAQFSNPRTAAKLAAADVRDEARHLLATLPPDPDAAAHRIALDRALGKRSNP
jgi:hypothetical protein